MLRYLSIFLILAFVACSDYDEVQYTVLIPDAGSDIIHFTDDNGLTINLDGSESTDVNNLGFEYNWVIVLQPEGSNVTLDGAKTAKPSFTVADGTSGRYVLSMTISRGNQKARDFVNVDVNPQIANILLVNAIDANSPATLNIPALQLTGDEVPALEADVTYHDVDLGLAADGSGNVEVAVAYNGATLTTQVAMQALSNYVIYLTGSETTPELLVVAKRYNNNTLPLGLSGLDAINLVDGVNSMVLFIDATAFNFGVLPIDVLFTAIGVPQTFGALDFKQNSEILFPTNSVVPLPIWATENGQRISNDSAIGLDPSGQTQFGTFVLFPDASNPLGNKLTFINNGALLQ